MTRLTSKVIRETAKTVSGRPVIVVIAPCGGSQDEARIGFRLKGKRAQYVMLLSDCYRIAALNYANKEAQAKRAARKAGVPWRRARIEFVRQNTIN